MIKQAPLRLGSQIHRYAREPCNGINDPRMPVFVLEGYHPASLLIVRKCAFNFGVHSSCYRLQKLPAQSPHMAR